MAHERYGSRAKRQNADLANVATETLRQRADYTHKFNARTGRHGWLRLTPAYSVKIVDELMESYREPLRILDPFCGTATTALSAACRGHTCVTTDINPFLVWLGRAKTAQYSKATIASTREAGARVVVAVNGEEVEPAPAPPIHHIDRWWPPNALEFLCRLRAGIDATTEDESPERDLLLVAFCRTLIELSNAAFDHQSMSFRNDDQLHLPMAIDMGNLFAEDLRFVLEGAADNPKGAGQVILGDSRKLQEAIDGTFDLVVTSPPYANRMSYIRELRPYMYWLRYLHSGRDAGEMDWSAIGGTWGVATSRLIAWERPAEPLQNALLDETLHRIAHHGNRNGKLLANYVAKYFEDMWTHLNSLIAVLSDRSEVHYIIGNSTFYGVLLPVERLYAAMFDQLGFEGIRCRAIRKRNSKKELFEFDVSARWTGRSERG